MLNNGNRSRRDGRLVAVLCQRFAGKKDLFLGRTGHGGCGVARNLRTPTVVAARLSAAAIIVSTGFAALWRRVLRRRKIASAGTTLWSAAMASATTSPTAPAATIPASVTAAIPAPAKTLSRTVVATAGWIVLCWVVMGREILGRGGVGVRLALLGRLGVLLYSGSRRKRVVMFQVLVLGGGSVLVGSVLFIYGFVLMELVVVCFFVVLVGPGQRFAWKHFHGRTNSRGQRCHGSLRLLVWVPVIVVFEIFKNIADIQESVAIQTDVHESGLHAWQNAGNFSFVDAADESELFFPLDVDFD